MLSIKPRQRAGEKGGNVQVGQVKLFEDPLETDTYASLFAIECEKLLVNNKITASCQAKRHYIKRYKQQK